MQNHLEATPEIPDAASSSAVAASSSAVAASSAASSSSSAAAGPSADRAAMLQESRAISAYLAYLNKTTQGKPGRTPNPDKPKVRKSSPQTLQRQLDRLDKQIAEADVLKKLDLSQKRLEVQKSLREALKEAEAAPESGISRKERLEQDFITHAKSYGTRKGISYTAWRALKVPSAVLRRAGIYRGE